MTRRAGQMVYPWYRMYTEARTDAKLRALTKPQHYVWFNLLCLSGDQPERGVIVGYDPELLAVEVSDGDEALLLETIERLIKFRILQVVDVVGVSGWEFINFQKRQYDKPSDNPVAMRQRKQESRAQLAMSRNVTLRHALSQSDTDGEIDTDTDTDTDKSDTPVESERERAREGSAARSRRGADAPTLTRSRLRTPCLRTPCLRTPCLRAPASRDDSHGVVDAAEPGAAGAAGAAGAVAVGSPSLITVASPASASDHPAAAPSPAATPPISPTASAVKRQRAADPLWDACVAAIGHSPSNDIERGKWNKGLKALRQSRATPEEVTERCERYRQRCGDDMPLHPMVLAKNWTELAQEANPHGFTTPGRDNIAAKVYTGQTGPARSSRSAPLDRGGPTHPSGDPGGVSLSVPRSQDYPRRAVNRPSTSNGHGSHNRQVDDTDKWADFYARLDAEDAERASKSHPSGVPGYTQRAAQA